MRTKLHQFGLGAFAVRGRWQTAHMLNNDAWSAVAELAASQHGCFTTAQAATNDIGRRRLDRANRDGLVHRVAPRVYQFSGSPTSWMAQVSAVTLSSRGVASHRTAARLHGFDGFAGPEVEITVARQQSARLPGIITHRWTRPEPDLDHHDVGGIPCTSIAVTLAQLGAVVPPPVVERALDSAIRDGASLDWIRQTCERLHRPGPSGTGTLNRILIDPTRTGALPDSWFERLVQRILGERDIDPPVIQHDVTAHSGRRYRLDLAWPDAALGLECHSRTHHFGPSREAADHHRDLELAGAGWEVLYLTWEQKKRPELFVPLLEQTLRTRRSQLRPAA